MKLLSRIFLVAIILEIFGCANSKSINKQYLLGYWKTSEPNFTPNVILDNHTNFFVLLEDEESSDTLNFTYRLKGRKLFIYVPGRKFLASKNTILKLDKDSLIYKRKGDHKIYYYSRK